MNETRSASALDPRIVEALRRGSAIDITTTGRRTGQPRRVELVFHNLDGHIVISGHPGRPRGWLANLRAEPGFMFHLKGRVQADLPASARVVTDPAERERMLRSIATLWRLDLARMVASAPLVEVTFPDDDRG